MQFIAQVVIPLLVGFVMVVVGLELTPGDFRRVLHHRVQVVTLVLAQLTLLPLVAWVTGRMVRGDAQLGAGLILIAASPVAASASYYTLMARAEVTLAVSLTAITSALSLVAMPLVAAVGLEWLLAREAALHLPMAPAVRQLLVGLVMPLLLGMWIRQLAPQWTARYRRTLQGLSLLALLPVLLYIFVDQATMLARAWAQVLTATLLFTALSALVGYMVAMALRQAPRARTAVAICFCDRNLSSALLLGGTVLGRVDFLAFCAAFFVLQAAALLPVLAWLRRAPDLTQPNDSYPG